MEEFYNITKNNEKIDNCLSKNSMKEILISLLKRV